MTAREAGDATVAEVSGMLAQLQQAASVVAAQLRSTNRAFYGHLAEVYVWWRSASSVDGYLDAEYARLGIRYKRKVNYGTNFAPVFWLVWGRYNGLDDDKARRYSIVLNRFHDLYEAQKQYHTDTVAKLQNYLQAAGGIDGVVKDGMAEDESDEDSVGDDEADGVKVRAAVDVGAAIDDLYGAAHAFYESVQSPATAQLSTTPPATIDGLSVVLVNARGDAHQLVGASNDDSIIRPLLVHTYLHDFAALPPSIRCLAELVSTQCLPARLQPMYAALVDAAATVRSRKAVRRVLFRHDVGDFVLSPIRAKSGVVTIAAPVHVPLERRADAGSDALLSTRARRALERRLVSGKDFNLFEPNRTDTIPALAVGPASHVLRLQNRYAPQDFLFLDFWPYKNEEVVPGEQLAIAAGAESACAWRAVLSLSWFRTFALEFTLPWIQTHGKYIKRSQQRVLSLRFQRDALTLKFVHRDGVFENDHVIALPSISTTGKAIAVCALTKDFIVAMQAVADLGVVSPINLAVGRDALILDFATSAADYRIAIPTCSLDGVRSEGAFDQASVIALQEEPFESYNDQVEGDVEE
jgi:hypothetical protein